MITIASACWSLIALSIDLHIFFMFFLFIVFVSACFIDFVILLLDFCKFFIFL